MTGRTWKPLPGLPPNSWRLTSGQPVNRRRYPVIKKVAGSWKWPWFGLVMVSGAAWIVMDTTTGELSGLSRIWRDSTGFGPHGAANFVLVCASIALAGLLFLIYDSLGARILGWLTQSSPRGAVRASAPFLALAVASSILLG